MPEPSVPSDPASPEALDEARALLADVGRTMFRRGLTDAAGGNISVRVGDMFCMSPRDAGHRRHGGLAPREVLVFDGRGVRRSGLGRASRDLEVHLQIYRSAPETGAIVHAHAPLCLVYAAAGKTMPTVTAGAAELGTLPVVPGAEEGAEEAAEVAAALGGRRSQIAAFAAAVLVARHGIVIAARDLHSAYDALERLEANARCALMFSLLADHFGASSAAGQLVS